MKKRRLVYVFLLLLLIVGGKTDFASLETNSYGKWQQQWKQIEPIPIQMAVSPGGEPGTLRFSWYSKNGESKTQFRIGEEKTGKQSRKQSVITKNATPGYQYHHVEVENLTIGKTYYYQYTIEGNWTELYEVYVATTEQYQVAFAGDPQIGASVELQPTNEQKQAVCADSYHWNETLEVIQKNTTNLAFVVTAGDQVHTRNQKETLQDLFAENEVEYAGFLYPSLMRNLPVATSIGNHDSQSKNYQYHFNNPNADTGYGETDAGGDYYFIYGDVMYLMLNSNCMESEEHDRFLAWACENNPKVTWRIVVMHHDLFGAGKHSIQEEMVQLRASFIPVLRKYHVDLVLAGHDHCYARAYLPMEAQNVEQDSVTTGNFLPRDTSIPTLISMKYGITISKQILKKLVNTSNQKRTLRQQVMKKQIQAFQKVCEDTVAYHSEEGILFLAANSSTGSKYYEPCQTLPIYTAVSVQQNRSNYTLLDVSKERIKINTYYVDTREKVDQTIVLKK
ncbi:purple acid phosphatase family protein [Anaerosporobacter faecicola]|uniref:purple acid phosphatase family protein n=1 Tax=Anaerosporobacter faecicola TaxID=2718714 RepID=UPI0014387BE5|nr:metallophosphoesterase family protein [Anaerosporobacter faecicola]